MSKQELVFVDTLEQLRQVTQHLESVREFAVDLEHSDRSFQGFTCLMQVSTRTRDYVIDVLALRSHVGAALAGVFADATTLKVLHGADYDVLWLQKDFGLYVVNMFDTGQAARLLNMPCGLAHLLYYFCSVLTDKRHQRADWRTRPLPQDMLQYARMDTHYLLYIADSLRIRLLQAGDDVPPSLAVPLPVAGPQGALGTCYERSRQICLQRYEKPLFRDTDYVKLYQRFGVALGPTQLAVFAGLYAWRDRTARALDEAPGRVLPKRLLIALSQNMPASVPAVLQLVRQAPAAGEAAELVAVIKQAREQAPSKLVAEAVPLVDTDKAAGAPVADLPVTSDSEDQSESSGSEARASPASHPGDAAGVASEVGTDIRAATPADAPLTSGPMGVHHGQGAARLSQAAAVEDASTLAAIADVTDDSLQPAKLAGLEQYSLGALSVRKISVGPPVGHASSGGGMFGSSPQVQPGTAPAVASSGAGCAVVASAAHGRAETVAASFSLPCASAGLRDAPAAAAEACGEDSTGAASPRNAGAQVRAAADALRRETEEREASGGARPSAAALLDDAEDEEHLSVRERHLRKRRWQAADADGLLDDYTVVPFQTRVSGQAQRGRGRGRGEPRDFEAFDYEAALEKEGAGGSGRGAGRGARGGRPRGRGGKKQGIFEGRRSSGFNPYQLDESTFMAGGKRGNSGARSGNKSATFQ